MPIVVEPLFTPNVVDTPNAALINDLASGKIRRGNHSGVMYELPSESRAVRLQLTALQVMDGLDGPLGRAKGVYVVTNVVDGASSEPITFHGSAYRNIHNGDLLPIGPQQDAVFTVYHKTRPMPEVLSFNLLVLRSNADLREIGQALTHIREDKTYQQLTAAVSTAVTAVNPAYKVAFAAAQEAFALLGQYLQAKPDDQLGYLQANYTNIFDDLGKGHHPPDSPTRLVDKIRVGYQIDVA